MAPSLFGMFEKWTKKVTASTVESAKETLNDKLETYSGIIKIGLTIGVIIFGTKKINDHRLSKNQIQQPIDQKPIVINNYIYERGMYPYGGQKQQAYKKY